MDRPVPLPPMPDLGPVSFIPDPADPEGLMVNVAGVVRLARDAGTPEGERVCRAFVAAWDRSVGSRGTDQDRQFAALREAFAAVGTRFVTGGA